MVRDVGNVGVLRDGFREVEKGIEPGDRVVVAGMQRLRPGIEVTVEKYADPSVAAERQSLPSAPTPVATEPAEKPQIRRDTFRRRPRPLQTGRRVLGPFAERRVEPVEFSARAPPVERRKVVQASRPDRIPQTASG